MAQQSQPATEATGSGPIDPAAVLGDAADWHEQAHHDYLALYAALPLLGFSTEALAAFGDTIGTEALAETANYLADMSARFARLAKLAEAGAGTIAATLARRPDGEPAALAIAADLTAGTTDPGADAALIQQCADVFRLDEASRDKYVLAEEHDKIDRVAAAQFAREGEVLGNEYWELIRQIARTPATCPTGLRAKAKLLFDWVSTEAADAFPEKGDPDQMLGYSVAIDVIALA